MIITKMVSCFGRNTVDTLSVLRTQKQIGVDMFFENENLHSNVCQDDTMISVMSTIAQAESKIRSQNVKWGIKKRAQNTNASIYSPLFASLRRLLQGAQWYPVYQYGSCAHTTDF